MIEPEIPEPGESQVDEEAPSQPGDAAPPSETVSTRRVERLFPFVLRARSLIIGRDTLIRSKGRLHFILITHDLSENSRQEVLKDFMHYPVVQHYTSADLETHFKIRGAKVIGFQKSGLAQSIYAELKEYRINQPVIKPRKPESDKPSGVSSPPRP
jgi:hypothetical protein